MCLVAIKRWSSIEAGGDVRVAEARDVVLSGHGGSKERQVGRAQGTEAGGPSTTGRLGPAQGVEGGDAFAFQWCCRDGLQVALVGGDADLITTPQVAHPLAHETPPPLCFAATSYNALNWTFLGAPGKIRTCAHGLGK
jgi:hypothetical protein